MKPMVSVIMSVYNGQEYLAETLESVLNQTYHEWELVVINDCSTDSTAEILAEYAAKDERIHVHPNEVNLRLPSSLNKAISLSQGKYIARMDADDICLPDRLEKQVAFMEQHTDVALSSCRFFFMKNGVYTPGGVGGRCDFEALKAMLLVTNPILHPGVIAKAEVMKECLYDTTLTCTEDLELWTRIARKNYRIEIQPEFLMFYRLHDKQITSTTLARQHTEVLKIQQTHYAAQFASMSEDMAQFYISGVYFREEPDIEKFLAYAKWLRSAVKGTFDNGAVTYALLEILAEYKRNGVSKRDIVKAMLSLGIFSVMKDVVRRKNAAKHELEKCKTVAAAAGLKQKEGTEAFPIFE